VPRVSSKSVAVVGLVAAVVVVALLGFQLHRVHSEGWEWRLTPSAAPPKVHLMGRDYSRDDQEPMPPGLVNRGTTPGGGSIFTEAVSPTHSGVYFSVFVKDGSLAFRYSLMGGP